VVSVHGELDLATAPPLQRSLNDAVTSRSKLLVDLSACEFIDLAGIARLVLAFREAGPSMGLCGLNGQVLRVLKVCGIVGCIPAWDDREQAVAALQGVGAWSLWR
jgi:anti-anti-sigma factor